MKSNDVFPTGAPFPIVGIGASAGGLMALEQFLLHVPLYSGLAFVIVEHLDPHRAGMLVELLQRHTPLPVVEARDQVQVEPDHVYVIPPGHDLGVLQGVLHLLEPPEPRRLRLPIDFFFKSLADDRQQHSIGVVLSGMGADGTQGMRAIRQAAGACFVQTPVDAQFDSMPYRTQENRIDGLGNTFSDISVSKKLEAELRATQARLQSLMESSRLQRVGDGIS